MAPIYSTLRRVSVETRAPSAISPFGIIRKAAGIRAIAELLRRGYDVYPTLVDDQGIDCVVRQGPRKYFDVQVKARFSDVAIWNAGFFPALKIPRPRRNYVFVLYAEAIGERGTYWVIPSTHLARRCFALTIKSGPRRGHYRIKVNNDLRPLCSANIASSSGRTQ